MSVAELPVVCFIMSMPVVTIVLTQKRINSPTVHQYHVASEMFTKARITVAIACTWGLFQQILQQYYYTNIK